MRNNRDWGTRCLRIILASCLVLSLPYKLALASPSPSHIAGLKELNERIEQTNLFDFARKSYLTPFGIFVLEPIIRLWWLGHPISNSDWIGVQGLTSLSKRIDPGGRDDASNMFLYSCKGGWIDMGHVIYTALSYKLIQQALRGNPNLKLGLKFIISKEDMKDFKTISRELRSGNYRQDKNGNLMGYEFWSGYFAIRASKAIEVGQEDIKKRLTGVALAKNGNATSAWTLEDLPSNYYGILIADKLERTHRHSTAVNQFQNEVIKLLKSFQVIELDNKLSNSKCGNTARDVLLKDATYYKKIAETSQVTHKASDSQNPMSPYNYSIIPKKTIRHNCLCDNRNRPIRVP